MAYIFIAVLAAIVLTIFWWSNKQAKRQREWRRQKELGIIKKRARIAAQKKSKAANEEE